MENHSLKFFEAHNWMVCDDLLPSRISIMLINFKPFWGSWMFLNFNKLITKRWILNFFFFFTKVLSSYVIWRHIEFHWCMWAINLIIVINKSIIECNFNVIGFISTLVQKLLMYFLFFFFYDATLINRCSIKFYNIFTFMFNIFIFNIIVTFIL